MNMTTEQRAKLQDIGAATQANTFVYGSQTDNDIIALAGAGYIEGNIAMQDTLGNIAFRATPTGLAALVAPVVAPAAVSTVAAIAASHPGFAVGTGFVLPQRKSKSEAGPGTTKYPFDTLEINGWIFVPSTAERPDQKKSLASTISSANKRFAKTTPPRYFVTKRAEAGKEIGGQLPPSDGAYIIRVEPPVVAEPAAASVAPVAPAVAA